MNNMVSFSIVFVFPYMHLTSYALLGVGTEMKGVAGLMNNDV